MEVPQQRAFAQAGITAFNRGITGINRALDVDKEWDNTYNPDNRAFETTSAEAVAKGKSGLADGLESVRVLLPDAPLVGKLENDLNALDRIIKYDNDGGRMVLSSAVEAREHAVFAQDLLKSFL